MLWQEANGPLTPDIVLHHLCENEWCVNIEHLNPITQGQHLAEHGLTGDWGQSEKTHCPKNHPYDEDNTYTHHRKDGRIERHCRECVRDAKRRYRERQRNAS